MAKMKMVTLRLTIDVTYICNGVSVSVLKSGLEQVADGAAGRGSLTGATEAEVETWTAKVRRINERRKT